MIQKYRLQLQTRQRPVETFKNLYSYNPMSCQLGKSNATNFTFHKSYDFLTKFFIMYNTPTPYVPHYEIFNIIITHIFKAKNNDFRASGSLKCKNDYQVSEIHIRKRKIYYLKIPNIWCWSNQWIVFCNKNHGSNEGTQVFILTSFD